MHTGNPVTDVRGTTGRAGVEPPDKPSGSAGDGIRTRKRAGAAVRTNRNGPTMIELQLLLDHRGCGSSFTGLVSRFVEPKLVRALALKYDAEKSRICNPGGWWRNQLRLAGVKGL